MINKKNLISMIILFSLGLDKTWAIPVTINANDYTQGTDISTKINGVTLQQYQPTAGGNSILYTPSVVSDTFIGKKYISEGGNNDNFYQTIISSGGLIDSSIYSHIGAADGLNIITDQSFTINTFAFTAFSGAGDPMMALFFDYNDELIKYNWIYGNYPLPGCTVNCQTNYSYFDNLSSYSVHRIFLGCYSLAGGTNVDLVTIDVPEPSTLALLIIGLFGLAYSRKGYYPASGVSHKKD